MKSELLFGLCFTLSLVLVFGSVFSSFSINAFANVPGGTMGGGAGDSGGSGGSGGEDQNQGPETGDGGDGGGSGGGPETGDGGDGRGRTDPEGGDGGDGRRSGNNDNSDNDNANGPRSTAKEIECPPGQEVPLFSATCDLLQLPANTQCDETAEQKSLDSSPSSSSLSQEEESEAESGVVDNALQCVPPLQFGNLQNPNALLQEPDETFEDGIEFAPDECIETIQQSAANCM